MKELTFLEKVLNEKQELCVEVSKKVWEYAELSYNESQSCEVLCSTLESEGFKIKKNIAEIPTAFEARFVNGEGKPVMGFLGEFDALDALSQMAGVTEKCPIEAGKPGHGCGHNLLGAGSMGAAILLKEYLVANDLSGTVVFYGCPGEEGAGSKQFMARAGAFDDADFIYSWHPDTKNAVENCCSNAIMGANFTFKGISSHAGSTPHLGKSALDTAELMNIGVNYLREHMIDKARVHYAYSNTGGTAPNVIPDYASVKYEVRSPKVSQVKELFERVVNVAKGAALMVGTEMEYEITMAFSDYIPNPVLAEIASKCMQEVGAPAWDDADYSLAKKYLSSYDQKSYKGIEELLLEEYGEERTAELLEKPLYSVVDMYDAEKAKTSGGSTDVGDVCYVVPTLNISVATACVGNVGHTWQVTGQSNSSIGEKGMLTAAKVLALSAIRTMDNPEAIGRAKAIVQKQNGGRYVCPLPDEVAPPIGKY